MSDAPAPVVSSNRDVALTVKVEAELGAWVVAEALADGRTVSGYVRNLLIERRRAASGG